MTAKTGLFAVAAAAAIVTFAAEGNPTEQGPHCRRSGAG